MVGTFCCMLIKLRIIFVARVEGGRPRSIVKTGLCSVVMYILFINSACENSSGFFCGFVEKPVHAWRNAN